MDIGGPGNARQLAAQRRYSRGHSSGRMATHLGAYGDGEVPGAAFAMRACWRSDGGNGGVRDHRHARGRGPLGGVGLGARRERVGGGGR